MSHVLITSLLLLVTDMAHAGPARDEAFVAAMVRHAEATEESILAEGRALTAAELRLARAAGVEHAARVRVLLLDEVPIPDDPIVVEELERLGVLELLPLAGAAARGHGIIVTPRGAG